MFFLKENTTFTILKKITTILILLGAINFTSFAQSKPVPVADASAKVTKFYPNPATDAIRFELQKGADKILTLQLYNFMGKKVSEIQVNSSQLYISLDGFFRGVYVFQLRNKDGQIVDSGRFQVVK